MFRATQESLLGLLVGKDLWKVPHVFCAFNVEPLILDSLEYEVQQSSSLLRIVLFVVVQRAALLVELLKIREAQNVLVLRVVFPVVARLLEGPYLLVNEGLVFPEVAREFVHRVRKFVIHGPDVRGFVHRGPRLLPTYVFGSEEQGPLLDGEVFREYTARNTFHDAGVLLSVLLACMDLYPQMPQGDNAPIPLHDGSVLPGVDRSDQSLVDLYRLVQVLRLLLGPDGFLHLVLILAFALGDVRVAWVRQVEVELFDRPFVVLHLDFAPSDRDRKSVV